MRFSFSYLGFFLIASCAPHRDSSQEANVVEEATGEPQAAESREAEKIDWEHLVQYKITTLQDTDYEFAIRPMYSIYSKLYFQNGQLLRGENSIVKDDDLTSCEVSLNLTFFKKRRSLRKNESIAFREAKLRNRFIRAVSGDSQGWVLAESGKRIRRIECRKHSREGIFIEDLQKAFGPYISITKI